MKSRLVNVRVDEEHLRKARKLRANGVVLSELVREAIDARFEALGKEEQPRDVKRLIERLFEQYPDPVDLPARRYDVRDSREARAAIQRRLSRKRA